MEKAEMLKINKNCWDKVAPKFFGAESLPEYGPFTVTEEEIRLFDSIAQKKVLEIGCGSGHSLKYMAEKEAEELWGIDLSASQIQLAENTLKEFEPQLFYAAMEEEIGIPKDYFDIVYSIYALGWTIDLPKTLELIHSYLKENGSFIFSWEHPVYPHIKSENNSLILYNSYQTEGHEVWDSFKGENMPVIIPRRKLSTYINELVSAGFKIEKVVEGDVSDRFENEAGEYSSKYYSLYKTRMMPNTFIIKARK